MGDSAEWSGLAHHPRHVGADGTPKVGTFWTLLLRDYRPLEATG
jgi:hypothetical protein